MTNNIADCINEVVIPPKVFPMKIVILLTGATITLKKIKFSIPDDVRTKEHQAEYDWHANYPWKYKPLIIYSIHYSYS
jgi:hypothetical protein